MTTFELDQVYTKLCYALGKGDEKQISRALGRFALLAMLEIDNVGKIEALIERATREEEGTP